MKNILYILDTFPCITETFILREIEELQRKGIKIRILALKQPKVNTLQSSEVRENTLYLDSISSPAALLSVALFLITHPVKSVWLLKNLFKRTYDKKSSSFLLWIKVFCAVIVIKNAWNKHEILREMNHIHAHFAYITSDIAFGLSLLTSCKWSLSVHAWDIFSANNRNLFERIKDADRIFVCTQKGYDILSGVWEEYEPEHNIREIPLVLMRHGINPEEFNYHTEEKSTVSTSLSILSIGRLVKKKGFENLIEVCRILDEDNFEFQCNIIGDGPEKKSLEQLISRYSLEDKVFLQGYRTFSEIKNFFANSDVFVLTSQIADNGDADGIPNVIIESFAANVPVIATDTGAIDEIVINSKTGVLLPDTPSAPEQIAETIKNLPDFTINAKKFVIENFDIKKNIAPLQMYFRNFRT